MLPPETPAAPSPAPSFGRARVVSFAIIALISASLIIAPFLADLGPSFRATPVVEAATHKPGTVTVALGSPQTLDPAAAGDAGSAAVIAQVFEGLTTVDADYAVRPALAESWEFRDGGRTAVFHLRDGLAFSDGSPLTADDVKRSWLRVLDPQSPSPLVSLLDEVQGAQDYTAGRGTQDAVGIEADGQTLTVRFAEPATDFPAVTASPTLAVVPPVLPNGETFTPGEAFVASGGYVPISTSPTYVVLQANEHYWAGPPAIATVEVITTFDGSSGAEAFQAGDVDLTPIDPTDAQWIAWDGDLGPALRKGSSVGVEYLGFDASRAPFDDVRVRQAFARAVDWKRLVTLGSGGAQDPATGIVPPGIPDRSATDFMPPYDPAAARALLAEAGHAGGAGIGPIRFVTNGNQYAAAIAAQLKENLGVDVVTETMEFTQYFDRLAKDPPSMWTVDWVADYPGRTALLRLLLGTGQQNNFGRWSSSAFDAALAEGSAATDPSVAASAFDRAEGIVRDDAPIVPISYGTSYWLARDGLLGAGENGLGFIRLAGLAWAGE